MKRNEEKREEGERRRVSQWEKKGKTLEEQGTTSRSLLLAFTLKVAIFLKKTESGPLVEVSRSRWTFEPRTLRAFCPILAFDTFARPRQSRIWEWYIGKRERERNKQTNKQIKRERKKEKIERERQEINHYDNMKPDHDQQSQWLENWDVKPRVYNFSRSYYSTCGSEMVIGLQVVALTQTSSQKTNKQKGILSTVSQEPIKSVWFSISHLWP
jgi:hypothetical protein